jgi:hypothetical protein
VLGEERVCCGVECLATVVSLTCAPVQVMKRVVHMWAIDALHLLLRPV